MVIVADKRLETDGSMHAFALRVNSPIPILLISRPQNYQFNNDIYELAGKPYVIWDVVEMGWDAPMIDTHFFGVNTYKFDNIFNGGEWKKLDDFIINNKPIRYFCRELLCKDASDFYVPIDYPCLYSVPPTQTEEEFNNRALQVSYTWGLSHEGRKKLHADIWANSGKYGYVVCDNIMNINGFLSNESNPKKWLTQNCPHYARYPMETINAISGASKISLSPAGAGRVCFRHTEVSMNSVMLMWEDDIKWSYDWIDNVNCIKVKEGEEIPTIIDALDNKNLYEIYKAGVDNCKKYQVDAYINEYITPLIINAK